MPPPLSEQNTRGSDRMWACLNSRVTCTVTCWTSLYTHTHVWMSYKTLCMYNYACTSFSSHSCVSFLLPALSLGLGGRIFHLRGATGVQCRVSIQYGRWNELVAKGNVTTQLLQRGNEVDLPPKLRTGNQSKKKNRFKSIFQINVQCTIYCYP